MNVIGDMIAQLQTNPSAIKPSNEAFDNVLSKLTSMNEDVKKENATASGSTTPKKDSGELLKVAKAAAVISALGTAMTMPIVQDQLTKLFDKPYMRYGLIALCLFLLSIIIIKKM